MNNQTAPRKLLWVGLAITCLIFSWYYALKVAQVGLASGGMVIHPDLYGVWNGSREILLHHRSPYSAQVTAQNQSFIYGSPAATHVEQQYAYPAFAAFPLAPLALLPFGAAQNAAFVGFLVLTLLSAMWWRGSRSDALLTCLLALSAYPVILGLQLRQPSLLFAALMAAATVQVRSRPMLAGVLLALATAKPQIALCACIPLLFWAISNWRERRAFLLSLGITEVALLAAVTVIVPSWFVQWLPILRSYSRYGGETLVVHFLGSTVGAIVSLLIAASILLVCWKWREEVLFSVAFSVAAFALIAPYEIYNQVLLLAPIFWLLSHVDEVRSFGWVHQVLLAATWLVLAEGFLIVAGLGLFGIFAPHAAARLWKLPLVWSFFGPVVVFATLVAYCVSAKRLTVVLLDSDLQERTVCSSIRGRG